MHMQMHQCPSPLRWPFQPEPWRKYSSIVVTCTAINSPLKTVKFQEKTFKSKRFLRLRQVSNLETGDSLTLTLSCITYYLITPRRQLPSERKLLSSIIMRSCEHCIAGRMMVSYYDDLYIKRHRRRSKKLTTVSAELTNPDLSSEIGFEDLATIGRR